MIGSLRRWSLGALLVLAGCGGGEPAPTVPVVILGLDTVRFDHLGVAGHPEIRTPHLDALAADGVHFPACRTTAPWTGPSFASLFTGLLPYRHGFLGGDYGRLAADRTTLAEILAGHGYATEAHVTVKWLTEPFGMAQGWQQLEHYSAAHAEALRLTTLGLEFAADRRAEPFALFLHYFDAHAPYRPSERFDRMYYTGDPEAPGASITQFLDAPGESRILPAVNREIYTWLSGVTDWLFPLKQYAAEVSQVDDHVGRVVARLKELGIYDRALIVAVSDHGEHLGEHDLWYTHALPYEETMRVPLIVKFPGGAHAGQSVPQAVSVTDVLPTILATLGLEIPDDLDGRDLTPLVGRPEAPAISRVVAERGGIPVRWTKTLVDGPWKLHLHHRDGEDIVELFDLDADPWETADLAAARPEVVERLQERLWEICEGDDRLAAAQPTEAGTLTEADRARLKSLGYAH